MFLYYSFTVLQLVVPACALSNGDILMILVRKSPSLLVDR